LKVDEEQSMSFGSMDDSDGTKVVGHFWMSREEAERTRKDRVVGVEIKEKSVTDLIRDLKNKNVQVGKTKKKARLVEMANAAGISLQKRVETIVPGWEKKPKGMLQILWERGFIYPKAKNPTKHYTIDGLKD
jgi:hypothetical protein